jgi:hypothetical protein
MRSERRITRIQVGQQQPLLLQVALDPSAGDYMVRLGGAVQLDTAASLSSTPVAQDAGATPTATQPAAAETATPADSEAATQPASEQPAVGKMSGLQKLWMRLGAASEMLGLSNLGKLRIDMKDGTSQEISLLKVKKLFAPKGADPASAEPSNEGWQRLWMKLGGAGELMSLASSGSMRIEMQDGTQQQFDLTRIKKVSLKK